MIWIVSKRVSGSESELKCRHQFIENVTQVRVSPWNKRVCAANRRFQSPVEFYQCASNKGVLLNYIDNVGTFGFATSVSERELFIHRKEGLIKAIRLAFDEVLE